MDNTMITRGGAVRAITELADEHLIPWQYRVPYGGGTNAGAIHRSRAGVLTGVVSLPVRYFHSPYALMRLDDFDNLLLRVALEDIAAEWGADLSGDPVAVQTLRRAVIEAKHQLSTLAVTTIAFHYQGRGYRREITRDVLEKLITPLVNRTLGPCRECMADAGVTPEQIDEVVLVGGSTRIPMVRQAVRALFKAEPHTELNPDEVVALGAAVQAGILSGHVHVSVV